MTTVRALPFIALAFTLAAHAQEVEVPPQPSTWEDLQKQQLDPTWLLPEDLKSATGSTHTDITEEVSALVEDRLDQVVEWQGKKLATFGDLAQALAGDPRSVASVRGLLSHVARTCPRWFKRHGDLSAQLLADAVVRGDAWSPKKDSDADGIIIGEAYELSRLSDAHWKKLGGEDEMHQGAVFIRADAKAIKDVENDYDGYFDHVGAAYEHIYPVPGTHLRGTDDRGKPFASLQVCFRSDLPFPFSAYDCDLQVYNCIDAKGRLTTYVYSTSEDFYWLAGRDTFVPVKAGDGTVIGTILSRVFGFDLRGVPDNSGARQQGIRSTLGNLKRRAEELTAKEGRPLEVPKGIPDFTARGTKEEK